MKFRTFWSVVSLIVIVILTGCNTATSQVVSTAADTTSANEGPTEIAPPPADKGLITGTLVYTTTEGEQKVIPYEGLRLYLGILLTADDGKSTLARVDPLHAPQAITDANGRFTFTDLDPTKYILVVQVPPNNLMKLNDPETGLDMLVEAKAGEIVDIGPQDHYLPWFIETPGPSQ